MVQQHISEAIPTDWLTYVSGNELHLYAEFFADNTNWLMDAPAIHIFRVLEELGILDMPAHPFFETADRVRYVVCTYERQDAMTGEYEAVRVKRDEISLGRDLFSLYIDEIVQNIWDNREKDQADGCCYISMNETNPA